MGFTWTDNSSPNREETERVCGNDGQTIVTSVKFLIVGLCSRETFCSVYFFSKLDKVFGLGDVIHSVWEGREGDILDNFVVVDGFFSDGTEC